MRTFAYANSQLPICAYTHIYIYGLSCVVRSTMNFFSIQRDNAIPASTGAPCRDVYDSLLPGYKLYSFGVRIPIRTVAPSTRFLCLARLHLLRDSVCVYICVQTYFFIIPFRFNPNERFEAFYSSPFSRVIDYFAGRRVKYFSLYLRSTCSSMCDESNRETERRLLVISEI